MDIPITTINFGDETKSEGGRDVLPCTGISIIHLVQQGQRRDENDINHFEIIYILYDTIIINGWISGEGSVLLTWY